MAPFTGHSGNRNIIGTEDRPVTTWGQGWSKILTTEGQNKGMFLEGDGIVLSLDCDGCYVHIRIASICRVHSLKLT